MNRTEEIAIEIRALKWCRVLVHPDSMSHRCGECDDARNAIEHRIEELENEHKEKIKAVASKAGVGFRSYIPNPLRD